MSFKVVLNNFLENEAIINLTEKIFLGHIDEKLIFGNHIGKICKQLASLCFAIREVLNQFQYNKEV